MSESAEKSAAMFFASFRAGEGCKSYIVGCTDSCTAVIIDPALDLVNRYVGELGKHGLGLRYIIDSHTHADQFSGARSLRDRLGAPIVMHRNSPAPYVDLHVEDGHSLPLGTMRLRILHTPGHTADSMAIVIEDRVFTGDTLLIGGTGRSDLPSRDAANFTTVSSENSSHFPTTHLSTRLTITKAANTPRSVMSGGQTHVWPRARARNSSS